MEQLLQQQHAQNGTSNFSQEELKTSLGGILSFIKSKFGSVDFEKIQAAIPQTDELVTKAESDNASSRAAGDGKGGGGSGNLVSSAMGMLGGGSSSGGGEGEGGGSNPIESMTQLLGYLGKMGIDPKQIMSFLPIVASFLKDNAGVDVSSILGTPSTGSSEAGDNAASGGNNDAVGNLMNQASGFMSSFSGKK